MNRCPHELLLLGLRAGEQEHAETSVPLDRRLARHLADLVDLQKRGLLNDMECERARRRLLGQ